MCIRDRTTAGQGRQQMLHSGHAVSPQLQRCAELTVLHLIRAETNRFGSPLKAQIKPGLLTGAEANGRNNTAVQTDPLPLHLGSKGPGA